MNKTQALSRICKVLGRKAVITDSKRPSSPDIRRAQSSERIAAREARQACYDALEARKKALLEADPEYRNLRDAYDVARKALDRAPFPGYRYDACIDEGFCLSVRAQADNLEELVELVEAKKARTAA